MKYKTIGAFKNVQNIPYCKEMCIRDRYIGERQSRRAGAVCKTVAFELSGFDSHLSYQI